jgi:prepilin-type N-terminal cleavage/methylation domain-containing protein
MRVAPLNKSFKHFDESGFTLLEIIAVIVILSIIAVVAVPRYYDLQEEARNKTIKSGLAEAVGRVNGHFAEALLAGSMPDQIDLRASVLGKDIGDFILSTDDSQAQAIVNGGAATFYIKVKAKDDTGLKGMSIDTNLPRPGL